MVKSIANADVQFGLEYDFFIEYEEFKDDNKDAEELFLAGEEIDDNSSNYQTEYSVSQDEPQDSSKLYRKWELILKLHDIYIMW